MKKIRFRFRTNFGNQITFRSKDPDLILFELILSEKEIPYDKEVFESFIPRVSFYFSDQYFPKALSHYKKLKKTQGKSFYKPNFLLTIFLFSIILFSIILFIFIVKWKT